MVLTRGPWINDWINLPNATLSLFFIAGIYFRGFLIPSILLISAGLINFLAVKSGVSSWCISPAYGFLVPTYLCLWFAGSQFDNLQMSTFRECSRLSLFLLLSSTAAFILSTGSFHLLSGRYVGVPVMEQVANSINYYPGYIGGAFLYVGIFLMGIKIKGLFKAYSNHPFLSKANQV